MKISRSRLLRNPRGARRARRNPVELLVVNPGRPNKRRRRARRASQKRKTNMARRRRNPMRNAKGRFVKRSNPKRRRRARRLRANPRRRRRARHNPALVANPAPRRRRRRARANPIRRRRRARRLRANPVRRRRHRRVRHNPIRRHRRRHARRNPSRRRRRLRRNPSTAVAKRGSTAVTRKRRRRRSKGMQAVARLRSAWKRSKKRSLGRRVRHAQYLRGSVLRRLGKKQSKSPLAKAMHIKTNPGLSGLVVAAKVIVPQAIVGAGSMIGLAMGGRKISAMITNEAGAAGLPGAVRKTFAAADGSLNTLGKYMPAISTAALTGLGYVAADKFAPKFKGAVAIGGLLGAILQGIVASIDPAKPDSIAAKAQKALLGDYTTVGFGDYTTVGGRAYAESGIFRDVGDYTTVGTGADNATEFAHDSLRGLDDTTEFAPGEGGVLAGGMFRGPSSR